MRKYELPKWAEVVESLNLTTPEGHLFYNEGTQEPLTVQDVLYILLTNGDCCPPEGVAWVYNTQHHGAVVHFNYKDYFLSEYRSTRFTTINGEYEEEDSVGLTTSIEILDWLLYEILSDADKEAIYSRLKYIEEGYPEGGDPYYVLPPESKMRISYEEEEYHIEFKGREHSYGLYTRQKGNIYVLLALLTLSKVEKAAFVVESSLRVLDSTTIISS